MSSVIWVVIVIVGAAAGVAAGLLLRSRVQSGKARQAQEQATQVIKEAEDKKKEILLEAKEEVVKLKSEIEAENRQRRAEIGRQEKKLNQRMENLDRKVEAFERRERALTQKEQEIEAGLVRVEKLKQEQRQQLEVIAGMSSAEAKEQLLKLVEGETRDALAQRMRQVEAQMKSEVDENARKALAEALQRCASEVATESTVSVVPLPNDEMKGRLIGREGRNIRALEAATGVDLIVDDTPEAVTLSCFDPVRREVARLALERLIVDGRIHPGRIEDVVEKARKEVEANIQAEGEKLAFRAGVVGLHPEIIKTMGRLRYRFSYGQNMLSHSFEVAQLSAALATEIGADVETAKAAGLLHDIGKAVSQEAEGPHAIVGGNMLRRLDVPAVIVDAVAGHHGEAGSLGIYGFIVSAADAISSARPGARQESIEDYVKRIETLENIANGFTGVEKSFAIQAGREVRILVKPTEVDDLGALRLARDISKKIEEELTYPGQIKITVIRETRSVEYAK
ncbi:MAG: ribonuclease Y [Chloroflexi bacterium]|nr:ribonuclease Y [Chloroflexota bacterium]